MRLASQKEPRTALWALPPEPSLAQIRRLCAEGQFAVEVRSVLVHPKIKRGILIAEYVRVAVIVGEVIRMVGV
jgi:hypothetical protein